MSTKSCLEGQETAVAKLRGGFVDRAIAEPSLVRDLPVELQDIGD